MLRLLALLVTLTVLGLAASAQAATLSKSGGTILLDGSSGGLGYDQRLSWVPGPCEYAVKEGDDGPRTTFTDPAGCVIANLSGTEPGPGCSYADPLHPMFEDPAKPLLGLVCGASGASRVEVRGSDEDEEVEFRPEYAFPGTTSVSLGGGHDTITSEDGARQEIDCGAGHDTSTEDPGDVSTGCEEGEMIVDGPISGGAGIVERRGDTLVADLKGVRGNELHRTVLSTYPTGASGGGLSFSLIAREPLRAGDGCVLRNGLSSADPPSPLCAFGGLRALQVRGPEVLTEPFYLDLDLSPEEGTGLPQLPAEVLAGRGYAQIEAADGAPQHLDCGPGLDRVVADASDVVEGDCEVSRGEGTLKPAVLGAIRSKATTQNGSLRWLGRSGQAVMVRVACPASATDGCGGTLRATFARSPRLAFGARDYSVPPGRTTKVGIALGVDSGDFRADGEGPLRRRYQSERRRTGRLLLDVEAVHGFGAHRTATRGKVVARR